MDLHGRVIKYSVSSRPSTSTDDIQGQRGRSNVDDTSQVVILSSFDLSLSYASRPSDVGSLTMQWNGEIMRRGEFPRARITRRVEFSHRENQRPSALSDDYPIFFFSGEYFCEILRNAQRAREVIKLWRNYNREKKSDLKTSELYSPLLKMQSEIQRPHAN